MGSIRGTVKASVGAESQRRQVYQTILEELLAAGQQELPPGRLEQLIHYITEGYI
jgi:hypothetical protein